MTGREKGVGGAGGGVGGMTLGGAWQSATTGERPTGFVRSRPNDHGLLNTSGVSRSG